MDNCLRSSLEISKIAVNPLALFSLEKSSMLFPVQSLFKKINRLLKYLADDNFGRRKGTNHVASLGVSCGLGNHKSGPVLLKLSIFREIQIAKR